MTRFYCPDCKRMVAGKKQWLDFFVIWLVISSLIGALFSFYLYNISVSIFGQMPNTYELLSVFAIAMTLAPVIAYFVVPEKCPICNLDPADTRE